MEFIKFKSILELVKMFDTEQKCIDYLTVRRWKGNVVSPFDETSQVYVCKGNKYKCRNTNKYFNVRTGTMFDDTKLPLQKWFMAIYLIASHKKGISSYQIARDLGITQKSAWFMLHRIRYSFNQDSFKEKLNNVVEMDETFVGGKRTNKHKSVRDKLSKEGDGYIHMTPVFGLLERGGNIRAGVISEAKGIVLKPIIREVVDKDAIIITDGFGGYSGLHKEYKQHEIINHQKNEFKRGIYHTNGIEGFWSMLKRGIIGIYHQVSPKHLEQYVIEFTFRYNSRKFSESQRFAVVLSNTSNRRLSYKNLVLK